MKMNENQSVPHLRPMKCELGQLTRPDGSATLFQGDTCVMTAVYGPGEVRMNKELIGQATVDIVFKPKSGLPACAEKYTEVTLANTCETVLLASLHPRSAINLTVQEVQNSGSFLATCVNSCCLALLDASMNMNATVAAVNCCITKENDIVVDPSSKDEENSRASLTFVFESVKKDIITTSAQGQFSAEEFQSCLITCREATASVFQFYRDTITRKLSKCV
ncbi:exosome complex component RRP46-like [Mya arenaria]|uniref:exosome complex component RRP46-like n=1 Tax=Mya arenaria TaxID=6604 RepID=UPI0022E5DE43|nr:exosome complex component RRP46-like [Mya arenaria]XP_052771213.1 exosome complex component RRP46-like [Mya arenaria]